MECRGPDERDGGSADAEVSNVITYNAASITCEKGQEWQRALGLLSAMVRAKVEANTISYNAAISACEKGQQWQLALGLLSRMEQAEVEANTIRYTAAIIACEKGQ